MVGWLWWLSRRGKKERLDRWMDGWMDRWMEKVKEGSGTKGLEEKVTLADGIEKKGTAEREKGGGMNGGGWEE
ncbi:hypothetical protein M0802_011702 [Mischocyttarus mexicanus]|nr:hypothetical protein M0802_011702 [Mischocyttarus mexicanus]